MNTKTIYTILAVVTVVILGYYFINNQTSTNQLPINNFITDEVINEPGDTSSPVSDDGYLTYTSDAYGFSIDYPKNWHWNATAEIRDLSCKVFEINTEDDCGDGRHSQQTLAYFSNWDKGYCAPKFGCIDENLTSDNKINPPTDLEYLTIHLVSDDVYAEGTKSKVSSNYREYELIERDGVSIHSYRSIKQDLDGCNFEYAYWSDNGNNFEFTMPGQVGCTMTDRAIKTYRYMLNSLKFS